MTNEELLKKAKKVYQKKSGKRNGCVAFALDENNKRDNSKIYFAISGLDDSNPVVKEIESMLKFDKHKAYQCDYSDSFTVVEPLAKDYNYKELNNRTTEKNTLLSISKKVVYSNLIFPMKYNEKYADRNWTCVERKIYARLSLAQRRNFTIFVTKKPCYLCIPLVSKVKFINCGSIEGYNLLKKVIDVNELEILND